MDELVARAVAVPSLRVTKDDIGDSYEHASMYALVVTGEGAACTDKGILLYRRGSSTCQ